MIKLSEHYFKLANASNIINKIDPSSFRKFISNPGKSMAVGAGILGLAKSGLPDMLGASPGTVKFLSGSAPLLGYNVAKINSTIGGLAAREEAVIKALKNKLITPEQFSNHYLRDIPIMQHAAKYKQLEDALGKQVMKDYKRSFIIR